MMPTDSVYGGWPKSGEIDIVEAVNLKTVDEEGNVEKVFDKFKTKEHHLVILNYLNA